MFGLAAGVGAGATFALFIAFAERLGRRPVRWRWLAVALALLLGYWAAVVAGAAVQSGLPFAGGLRWNWVGKAISTGVTLVATFAVLRGAALEAGLTLRARSGSLRPALTVTGALCAASWIAEALAADGRDMSAERLAFQALMPGLDEELFFRGLFLAVLTRALPDRGRLFGAPVGPADAVVAFVFAAGHGVGWGPAGATLDLPAFALTGGLGAGLLWLRRRTGSLLAPIAAHNLINLGNSFF